MFRDMVDKVKAAGATMVICQKEIDDVAQNMLARPVYLAVERPTSTRCRRYQRPPVPG